MNIINLFRKYKRKLDRSDNSSIDYEEAIELSNLGEAIIIDVRTEEEYREEHINGALNIPVYEIENNLAKFGKNKNMIIILYCATGKRSKVARDILIKEGYKNVKILYI